MQDSHFPQQFYIRKGYWNIYLCIYMFAILCGHIYVTLNYKPLTGERKTAEVLIRKASRLSRRQCML